jgi:TIGR03009 family protein
MRHHGLVLAALVLAATAASAQQQARQQPPSQPAAAAPADPQLDAYLQRWEQEMQRVQTLQATLVRLDNDKSFGNIQKFTGYAQYMKAGTGATALNLASLQLGPEGKQEIHEKYVCTGTYIYQFCPAQKEIKVIELPKPAAGREEDSSFLSFLFGMKAADARKRYDLRLIKEDKYYVYVSIAPRFTEDRRDFTRARLVLNKDSFLPRQLWFEQPNKNEVTWDIPRLQTGISLNRAAFDKPELPPGWKFNLVTRQAPQEPYKVRGERR